MKNICICCCWLLLNLLNAHSQADSTHFFNHTYKKGNDFTFNAGALETDDAYLIVTNHFSDDTTNISGFSLRKINKENGNTIWRKILRDTLRLNTTYYDRELTLTDEGNYILTANTRHYNNTNKKDVLLMSFDKEGQVLSKSIIGDSATFEMSKCIVNLGNGAGYIVGGTYEWHAYLLRLDKNGHKLWQRHYVNPYDSIQQTRTALNVYPTSDKGFIFSGWVTKESPTGGYDPIFKMYVTKTDSLGNEIWTLYPKGDDDENDGGCGMYNMGGFYLINARVDRKEDNEYGKNYFALISKDGQMGEEVIVNIPQVSAIQGMLHFYPNDGFIGAAVYLNEYKNTEAWLGRFSANFELLWSRRYTTNPQIDHYFRGMLPTQDGGFLLTGLSMEGYAWELKVDSLGNTCWFNAPPQWEQATDPEGNTYYTAGCDSLHLVPWTVGIDETFPTLGGQGGVSISPNPADVEAWITLPQLQKWYLYDLNGRLLLQQAQNRVPTAHLPAGLYMLQIYDKQGNRFTHQLNVVHP
ncbi:MAG: T9SS type A sorting domain-containing protein [Sphingobacteriales bacterium]|nr:T9SS type A sorting domain-containing protein [Sphingobacteriales bacterium]